MTNEEALQYGRLMLSLEEDNAMYNFIAKAIEVLNHDPCEDISEDGTLTVTVDDGTRVSRVLVCGKNHFGGLYYPEQDPCTDAISRQAVIELCEGWWLGHTKEDDFATEVRALPSVTPAEKMGRWVFVKGYEGILYECTVCRNKNTHTTVRWNYCPHCGAKMQEVE